MRSMLLLLAGMFAASPGACDGLFESAVSPDMVDYEYSRAFPRPAASTHDFKYADSRADAIARTLHARLPLHPHGGWHTAETAREQRYLRIAFRESIPVGTIIGGAGQISYLKADAAYPGDVTDDEQWVSVRVPEGQAGLRVVPFPPGVTTRAIRLSFVRASAHGRKSRSGIGGMLIVKARLHNLTPEATAIASSERSGAANVTEANRVENLVTGGTWTAAPERDVSPENPQWVILQWPAPRAFVGVGFVNAFAKRLEVDVLEAGEATRPATAAESSWHHVGGLDWPVWWRPAYTDAYLEFDEPVKTRAIRVRVTEPLTDENPDIAHVSKGGRRVVKLEGLLAFTDLGDRPVPPRPAAAAEEPPIAIRYEMPFDGKLALAIDGAQGRRVRNLVADVDRSAGAGIEHWDGRDDEGDLVAPGEYHWKAIAHRPLHLNYQLTVNCSGDPPWWKSPDWAPQRGAGSWLSDHAPPNDVTAIGDRVFIGAEIAESGHTILACDLEGEKVWGAKWLETAGAGFLCNDGQKVYSLGEGGWIGDRLMVHEIDPGTFEWRRVTQLVYDTGNGPTGGASGVAAREGKLYIAFNHPKRAWIRSGIASGNIDMAQSTPVEFRHGGSLAGFLRCDGEVPAHGVWRAPKSRNDVQHIRLAFKEPQPVGAVIAAQPLQVSALRASAEYPGDVRRDEQWTAFSEPSGGPLCVMTAPPELTTRALRFTFRRDEEMDERWQAELRGAMVLSRRFEGASDGASYFPLVGEIDDNDGWRARTDKPITPDSPATVMVSWPEARAFRGLAFIGCFAKRVEIDEYVGPDEAEPAGAREAAWRNIGAIEPAVRWRPMYSDDYFDAGETITTKAIRLRVVEPWIAENGDIRGRTGNEPTYAGLEGMIALKHIGDDPPQLQMPTQRISIVDISTGEWERHIEVAEPRSPTFDPEGNLVCVSGGRIVRVDLETGQVTPVVSEGLGDPRGLAFDSRGRLYVADAEENQVKVFGRDGRMVRAIGAPGGRSVGPYQPTRMQGPRGIAIDARDHLWVAEHCYQPKRTSVWTTDGEFVRELIGPARYGGGGFVDPRDTSRFYYRGMEFRIDWDSGDWRIANILTRDQPASSGIHTHHPVYLNDIQYMVNDPSHFEPLLLIGRFDNGRVRPLAAVGNADHWQPFSADPELAELARGKVLRLHSFAWADRDGDGRPQPAEVTLSKPHVRLDPTYWPSFINEKLEVYFGGRLLKPAGFTDCGAPIYRPLDTEMLPELPSENVYATAVDEHGRVLVNGRPIVAMGPDGEIDWTYPQEWVGVHDSHRAPSPKPGQLIGGLGFIGQQFVPGAGNTFMLSGNKGEWYLFTTDGLLAGVLWHDYREAGVSTWHFPEAERGMLLDDVTLGEEHFHGSFCRTEEGDYYVVAGHNHNSIVKVSGLETMQRLQGEITLSAEDVRVAEVWHIGRAASEAHKRTPKVLRVTGPAAAVEPDGDLSEWEDERFVPIDERGAFAVAWDAKNLYVAFRVDSGGPLRNGGEDPKMLFKTGDSVDVQIGADAGAAPSRTEPVPGDQRLLISRFEGEPIGVLYKHRVPGTAAEERTGFPSPWRTEYVDEIVRLSADRIGIARTNDGYAVEAVVPLSRLGLEPEAGATYKADFGILSGDKSGTATQVRTYWANEATGIISDVPSEIMLTPVLWGDLRFE